MKRLLITFLFLIESFIPVKAQVQLNPYQIGMQYCQMVESGISREKAWDYVVESYASSSPYDSSRLLNRGDPYAPWSPNNSLGGRAGSAVGAGLASGIAIGMQLRSMKPDIESVIAANCPIGGSGGNASSNRWKPSDDPWNPEYLKSQPIPEPTTKGVIGIGFNCAHSVKKIQEFKHAGKTNDLSNEKSDDCRVTYIAENAPAYKDGRLRVTDKILEVNGRKVKQITVNELAKLIGGEPGTYVTILIGGNPRPITIKRVAAASLKNN